MPPERPVHRILIQSRPGAGELGGDLAEGPQPLGELLVSERLDQVLDHAQGDRLPDGLQLRGAGQGQHAAGEPGRAHLPQHLQPVPVRQVHVQQDYIHPERLTLL